MKNNVQYPMQCSFCGKILYSNYPHKKDVVICKKCNEASNPGTQACMAGIALKNIFIKLNKMKKLLKLKDKVSILQEEAAQNISTKPVQYWTGGDWQVQAFEKAYSNVLQMIEKLTS